MANSYTVPDSIKYRTPIYIHSHRTPLNTDQAVQRILVQRAQNDLTAEVEHIKSVISTLKSISMNPTVQQFYHDTHSGHTRIHSKKTQSLINNFEKARLELIKLKNDQKGATAEVYHTTEDFWVK